MIKGGQLKCLICGTVLVRVSTNLSRKFYSSDSGVVGVLDPAKVTRIISFNDKGKCLANMSQQMLSFFDEVRLGEGSQWHRDYELTWKNNGLQMVTEQDRIQTL